MATALFNRCQGNPTTSACNCSVVSDTEVPSSALAQTNPPRCSRLAQSQRPNPSCTRTLIRLARRFAKKYA